MGRRISKEFLHPSILEGVNNKIGNLDSLETDAKGNMVQAINELVEKLDNSAEIENGKGLIANAVGMSISYMTSLPSNNTYTYTINFENTLDSIPSRILVYFRDINDDTTSSKYAITFDSKRTCKFMGSATGTVTITLSSITTSQATIKIVSTSGYLRCYASQYTLIV